MLRRCGTRILTREYGYHTSSVGDFSTAFGFYPHSGRNDIIKQSIVLKPSPSGARRGGTKCRKNSPQVTVFSQSGEVAMLRAGQASATWQSHGREMSPSHPRQNTRPWRLATERSPAVKTKTNVHEYLNTRQNSRPCRLATEKSPAGETKTPLYNYPEYSSAAACRTRREK